MQPTYFASFLLGEKADNDPPRIEDALQVIDNWIFANSFRPLTRPDDWIARGSEGLVFPGGERMRVLQYIDDSILRAVAVRFEHSDQESRLWRTDCVLSIEPDKAAALRFAVTVSAGSSEGSIYPVFTPSTRPRVVKSMMDQFGARESFPLKSKWIRVARNEESQFVDFLLSEQRTLPVVFVSRMNTDDSLACDPEEIADRLAGIAYVCVAEDSQISRQLMEHLDNQLNTYDGAVRIYWPRMSTDDPPYRHRFWSRHRLAQFDYMDKSFSSQLLYLISKASISRRVDGLTRWEDIERAEMTQFLRRHQEAGNAAQLDQAESIKWLQQYEEDLSELDATKKALEEANGRLEQVLDELRAWKQSYIQLLRQRGAPPAEAGTDQFDIEDAHDAIEAACRDFADRLFFVDGRIDKAAYQFEEPELLYAAFKWLHETYWPAKTGSEHCEDLDKSCREACRFRYSAHQSEVTMGMYRGDYELVHNGQKSWLKEHIGFGVSTDPRKTIRIAFFFDPKGRKVVIGYVGQHQTTRKSN